MQKIINTLKDSLKAHKDIIFKYLFKSLFVLLFIFLYVKNWITPIRVIIFFLILLLIYLYKLLIDKIEKALLIKNKNLLIILIYVDMIKISLIYTILYLYIWIYDIKNYSIKNKNSQLLKILEKLLRILYINPILLIISKIYDILEIWKSAAFIDILFNRVYGVVMAVLIFTPALNIIYKILGYNILWGYIIIIIISYLHDNLREIMGYKYLKYVSYVISKLGVLKNMALVLNKRRDVSILSKIIEQSLNNIRGRESPLNRYSFQINIIYKRLSPDFSNEVRKVVDLNITLKRAKIVVESERIVSGKRTAFSIYDSCIDYAMREIFEYLCKVKYYRWQKYIKFSQVQQFKMGKLEEFYYLLLRVILSYYWSILKLLGYSNEEILKEFHISKLHGTLEYNKIKRVDSKEDTWAVRYGLKKYKEYYQQVYLYVSIFEFYIIDLYRENVGINDNEYKYINKYIDIYGNNIKIWDGEEEVDEGEKRFIEKLYDNNNELYLDVMQVREGNWQKDVHKELDEVKDNLIKEWVEDSKDLTIENFYEKNNKKLEELNIYTKKEVELYCEEYGKIKENNKK